MRLVRLADLETATYVRKDELPPRQAEREAALSDRLLHGQQVVEEPHRGDRPQHEPNVHADGIERRPRRVAAHEARGAVLYGYPLLEGVAQHEHRVPALARDAECDPAGEHVHALGKPVQDQTQEVEGEEHEADHEPDDEQERRHHDRQARAPGIDREERRRDDAACGCDDDQGDGRQSPEGVRGAERVVLSGDPVWLSIAAG